MRGALSRDLLVAAAVMLLSCSANNAEAGSQPDKGALPSLAVDLYVAVTQGQSSDVIVPLVERAIAKAGHVCKPLRDYQVLPASGNVRTLKIKCAEKPAYQMMLHPKSGIHVTGGDGSIPSIDPHDGPVTAVWGMRAERYLADEARQRTVAPVAEVKKKVAVAAASTLPANDAWDYSLWAAALLTLLLALPLYVWLRMRPSPAAGFTSEEKDQLVEESQEILPEIYHHPEGWFIVRGQRGKRRVFRSLMFAYLYRNHGVKIREVR